MRSKLYRLSSSSKNYSSLPFPLYYKYKRLRPQKISRKQEKKKKQNWRRMVEYKLIETAAVGIVTLTALNLLVKALSHLYKTFLRPAKNFKKYGKWAVVTGATGKK